MTELHKELLKNTFKLLVFIGVIMGVVFASEFIFGTPMYAFMAFGLIFCGMFVWNISTSNISLRQIDPQDGRNSK
jgi:hypothetical protein